MSCLSYSLFVCVKKIVSCRLSLSNWFNRHFHICSCNCKRKSNWNSKILYNLSVSVSFSLSPSLSNELRVDPKQELSNQNKSSFACNKRQLRYVRYIEREEERERCIAYRMTKLAHNNGKCKCLFTAFVYVFPQLFLISDLKNILDKSKHGTQSPPPLAPSVKIAASIKKKRTESASFVCQRKATTTKAITATTTTTNNTSNDYNTYACACVCVFLHILRTIRVNVLAKPEVDLDTLELLLYPAMSECVRVECVCVCSSVCLCACVYSHLFAAFCRTFSAFVFLFLGFFL